ncbi:MAG: 50S ribosomal protein L23 [Woeseiaceae bacterium]|nr:50S ribosomal protein L23 [Woeseiaceae bacterium]
MSRAIHEERLMAVIQGPHLSEKSTLLAEEKNQVVFRVRPDATKAEIRKAVELLFEVDVEAVTVVNVRGKIKRHGLSSGRRASWKKAYVTLAEGSQLDFLGAE